MIAGFAAAIATSIACGALVGIDREMRRKAAGLKTHVLICMGSCLYTLFSAGFEHDQARVIAQVVSGIGFLGAGTIMRQTDKVSGLTTAACIWLLGAIGAACGLGYYSEAMACAALTVGVINLCNALEKRIAVRRRNDGRGDQAS